MKVAEMVKESSDKTVTNKVMTLKTVCEFDLEAFYKEHKGLVKKYLRKNTNNLKIEDWQEDDVPSDWFYKGREGILRANIRGREWSLYQKLEWIKCGLDVAYMTKKYIKIISLDEGIIDFKLYDYQEELLNKYQDNRFVISLQARQSGKTQTTAAFILWFIMFHKAKNAAILANKGEQAQEILERVQLSYEYLPLFLQPGVKVYNKKSMTLGNQSKAFSAASGSSSIRGKSIALLYIDECAFIPNDMQFYESTYPVVTSGKDSRVIISSTPNGTRGLFYKLWMESLQGKNSFARLKVTWDMVPGRDAEWKRETINNTSAEQFRQEFDVEFRGSTASLISGNQLEQMVVKDPIEERSSGCLKIFEEPKKDHSYVATVDVSRGVGGDFHAMSVIDISVNPFEVVCTFRDNKMSPLMYPNLIYNVLNEYNEALVLVEINDIGEQVSNDLYYELEYENVLSVVLEKSRQTIGFSTNSRTGVRTSKAVKAVGCSTIVTMVESGKINFNDEMIIDEFGTFVPKGGSYAAEEGSHDDMAMTMVLFAWLTTQDYFVDMTDISLKNNLMKEMKDRSMEDMMPFGIIDSNEFGTMDGSLDVMDDYGTF